MAKDAKGPKEPNESMVIQVVIEYEIGTGNLRMNGPWDNPLLFHGIISAARSAMEDTYRKMRTQHVDNGSKIVRPNFNPPPDIRRV